MQIPTSLLAQVDSSVGGKTGINTPQGKNLIGIFHQPSLVLADTDVLTTLPPREMRAGYAEVAKYGLLGDAAFFAWLEHPGAVFGNDAGASTRAIETSVRAKAGIVARDETRDRRPRATQSRPYVRPRARSLVPAIPTGCCTAKASPSAWPWRSASRRSSAFAPSSAARVEAHLSAVGLPTRIADIPGEKPDAVELVRLMGQDKKVRDGRLTFILVRGIGQAFITRDVEAHEVLAFLSREIAE